LQIDTAVHYHLIGISVNKTINQQQVLEQMNYKPDVKKIHWSKLQRHRLKSIHRLPNSFRTVSELGVERFYESDQT